MDSVFVPNPVLVDALAASVQSAGVAAMWIAAVLFISGIVLIVLASVYFEDIEATVAAVVAGAIFIVAAILIFGCHMDDVTAPRYEAIKQLTNKHYQGLMLPSSGN